MKYKRRPIIIDAIRYNGYNKEEIEKFIGSPLCEYLDANNFIENDDFTITYLKLETKNYNISIWNGDYIIKHVDNTFESLNSDTFQLLYEPIN